MSSSSDLATALATAQELVAKLLAEPVETERTETPSIVLLASLKVRANPALAAEAATWAINAPRLERLSKREPAVLERAELRKRLGEARPWQLAAYVLGREHVSARTHYNLACYYATLGRHSDQDQEAVFELALAQLDLALGSTGLAEWAGRDPSLAPLRTAHPAEFAAIVSRYTVTPHDEDEEVEAGSAAPAPNVPAATPTEEETDVLPVLLKLIAESGGIGTIDLGGSSDPYTYAIRGEHTDVLILRSDDPSYAESDALFDLAEKWEGRRPRLVMAVPAEVHARLRTRIRRGDHWIEFHPLAERE